jgi:hypothetical protein
MSRSKPAPKPASAAATKTSFVLPPAVSSGLARHAKANGVHQSFVVTRLIEAYLGGEIRVDRLPTVAGAGSAS